MPQKLEPSSYSDAYISKGNIGAVDLADACYTFADVLTLVAADLTLHGEVAAALALLNDGKVTVRGFLRQRYGVVLGFREYWQPPQVTPDTADLRALKSILRAGKRERRTPTPPPVSPNRFEQPFRNAKRATRSRVTRS